jgi:hypothetical protein
LVRPQRRARAAIKSPHLLDLSGIGNPGVLPSRRDSGAARIARRRRKLSGRLRAVHELASDHAGTLDGQTSGVAHVKEIVKYYAQRRGVLTFAPASSTACQDVPRTQGNQLRALPGYGPDIARNRAEAQQLMRKAGYGPDNPLKIQVSTRNTSYYRDPPVLLIDQLKQIYIDADLDPLARTTPQPQHHRSRSGRS